MRSPGQAAGSLIYLDHNATTPVADEVVEAVTRALRHAWGNPSSDHRPGQAARDATETARRQVASLLGSAPEEIVFTSGGTESDNLALLGAARARRKVGTRIVTSAVEHPAVERACDRLAEEGFHITRVGVRSDGRVDPDAFRAALSSDTAVASLMHANNETGALQPVSAVARATRPLGIPFHTDAAQSVGKLPVNVDDLGVDLLTVAAHKLYGPKGSGALYVRRGTLLSPLLHGAPQERGLRPGTENTPGATGLGAACALAEKELDYRVKHSRRLARRLLERLRSALPDVLLNGPEDMELRLPNTLNISLPGAPADRLLPLLPEIAASAGAACHAGRTEPSGVLVAMGLAAERALCAVRLSIGRDNTEEEIDRAADLFSRAVERLRRETGNPTAVSS